MHELAITQRVVAAVAERVGDAKVTCVRLEIGKLSGVAPDAVRFCFEMCARDTVLEGAALEVIEVPARAHCRDCEADVDLEDIIGICPCGSANLELVSGQELRIKEVEVT